MKKPAIRKKNLIVSYKNLTPEQLELFKQTYPEGYKDYIQRFEKPNGDVIFVVPVETEDTCYMVKMDVKMDSAMAAEAEFDKASYGEEESGDSGEFDSIETLERDSDTPDHTERHLHHGDYEEDLDNATAKLKKNTELSKELAEAFGDDDTDDYDEYKDDEDADGEDEDSEDMEDDFEPSLEDIMGIEDEMGNLIPPEDAELLGTADKSKEKASKKAPAPAKKTSRKKSSEK